MVLQCTLMLEILQSDSIVHFLYQCYNTRKVQEQSRGLYEKKQREKIKESDIQKAILNKTVCSVDATYIFHLSDSFLIST